MSEVETQPSGLITLARGARISLPGRVAGRVLSLGSQLVVARVLGPEAFGLYAIGWTFLRVGELVAPLGLQQGLIRFGARAYRGDPAALKGILFQCLGLATLSGVMIGGAVYLAAPWLAFEVYAKPGLVGVLRLFAVGIALVAAMNVAAAATRVSQRMQYSVMARELAQPGLALLLLIGVFALGLGLTGAVAAAVISLGLAALLALSYVARLFGDVLDRDIAIRWPGQELLLFSSTTAATAILSNAIFWTDRLILGYLRPATEVGIYQAATQAAALFSIVLSGLAMIFVPLIADHHHRQDMSGLAELYRVSTKWGVYLSLPLFLVMLLAPSEIMQAAFGADFGSGATALVILAVGQLVNVSTGAVGSLLIMTGHQKRWLGISALMLTSSVVLSFALIPRFGLEGAATAKASAISGLYLLGLLQVKRSLGLWPFDRRYWKGLVAAGAAGLALVLVKTISLGAPFVQVGLMVVAGAVAFGLMLLVQGVDPEDRELARAVTARLG